MTVLTSIQKIHLHQGSSITIPNFSWQEVEAILEALGSTTFKKKTMQAGINPNKLTIKATEVARLF